MKKIKNKIKINFEHFWENFDPEDNFFTNLLRKEYDVEVSEKPDYVFYSVYSKANLNPNFSKKGDLIKQVSPRLYYLLKKNYPKIIHLLKGKDKIAFHYPRHVVKIFYGAEHKKPNMKECDWAFSSHFEEEINHPRHMELPCYVVSDYKLGKKAIPAINKKIDFIKIKKEKKQFCNFIYSQYVPPRDNFFKKLNKYKHIDSPGKCMNNMPPIGNYKDPKKSRMSNIWVEEKLNFIKDYKFTIAFENASLLGFSTEKLTHPMLVNSIPIYFGHPSVSKRFNPKSFISYHDFKNVKEMIKHIKKVDNDDELYFKYLNEPFYRKGVGEKYFDEKRYLKRFKEIFDKD